MGEFLDLAASQLFKLLVLWPAWLLTPEGRRTVFTARNLRHLVLFLALLAAAVAVARIMPWGVSVLLSGDMVAYLDVTLIALAASLVGRVRDVARGVAALAALALARRRTGPRARTVRSRRPRRPPANDNEDAPPRRIAA